MASLTGQLVAETYKALLKLIDNDILTASEKQITDGFGGGSNVFIDSQGFLRANKYKVTNGLATQFLKADGSLDSNAYLTSITGAQVITALGYTPVPTTRTITINGETHNLAADNSWTVGGTAAIWGNITGTLSNQTDLQNALNAKYNNPTGTISQYIRGDGTLATFPTMPGGLPTGGSAGQILAKIDATDYNTQWIDNYATQTKNEVKLGQTLAKGAAVYVSSANGTNIIVSAASNASESLSSKTFGLLETGGTTNDLVKCVTFGLLAGLDTSTAQAGDPVWLGVNGALIFGLANKPVAPANLVYIGVVTRVQSNNGEIFVNVQNGFEIEELHDVLIQSKANNQGLFYESSTGLWKNKSISTVLGYTPQAQLNGTGFVKASGTTISYDNSTYLTIADAASTYQLLTNLSTDLTASETKYPSVNAVIAGLGTKLNLTGGTLTGNLTISSANPKLLLTDSDNNPDYSIQNADGTFKITDETNSADRFLIYSTGIGYYNGDFKANKLFVQGGLSTQFIKADGTLDSNTYLTAASLDGYLAKSGGTMTGDLNFYTLKTTRVGGNAYIRGSWQGTYWGIGAAATGHTIIIDQVDFSTGAYESITDVNLMLGTRTVVHSGNVATYALPITGGTVTGSITATSFVKSGGTSSQFLMADGSVTTLSSPVTGSGSAGYVPKWTTAANIGSSNIYDDGTSIGIAYSTPNKGGYGRTLTGAAFGSASFGFEAVGGTTTNGGLVGGLSFILSQNDSSRLVGSAIQSNLVGTTATNYGADLRFYAKADAGVLGEVARMTSAGLRVYGTIVKDGGTSSQVLMADGSVSALPSLSGYVPYTGATTSLNLGSYAITANRIYGNYSSVLDTYTLANPSTNVLLMSSPNDRDAWIYLDQAATTSNWGIYHRNIDTAVSNLPANSIGFIGGGTSTLQAYISLQNGNGYFAGNLAIGTTSATYNLDVNATGGIVARFTGNSGAYIILKSNGVREWWFANGVVSGNDGWFSLYNATAAFNALTITSGNNVLIGTTTDSGYKLDVNGTGRFTGSIYLTQSTYTMPALTPSSFGYSSSYNVVILGNSSGAQSRSLAFNVDVSGNPSGAFNGYGSEYIWRNAGSFITPNSANNGYNTLLSWNSSGQLTIPQAATFSSSVTANNTITTNKAKSGSSVEANNFLDLVQTGSHAIGDSMLIRFAPGGYSYVAQIGAILGGDNVAYGSLAFSTRNYFTDSMVEVMRINNRGNVGIGVTSPDAIFHVAKVNSGGLGGQIVIDNPASSTLGNSVEISFLTDAGASGAGTRNARIRVQNENAGNGAANMQFWTWNGGTDAERMRITSGGNVLIGTTTDNGQKLQVNGGIYGEYLRQNSRSGDGGTTMYTGSTGSSLSISNGTSTATINRYTYSGFAGFVASNSEFYGICNDHEYGGPGAQLSIISGQSTGTIAFFAGNPTIKANGAYQAPRVGYMSSSAFVMAVNITAPAFFESSDIRLKTLIENNPIIDGIEKLEAKLYEKNGKIELGYFAQDAELIMPNAVQKGTDGFLNLSYREVHTAKIARLEKRVAELEKQLNLN